MGKGARVLLWVVIVAAIGGPYVHGAVAWYQDPLLARPLPPRALPDQIVWSALIALPIALVGLLLAFRSREARRFRPPDARTAGWSLVAVFLVVLGFQLEYFLLLLDVWIPSGWRVVIRYATQGIAGLLMWRVLGRRTLQDAWGLGLGERPLREVLVGLLALAWQLSVSALLLRASVQTAYAVGASLTTVVIAPVVEEVFFRGALYTVLRRSQGWIWAAGVSALLFALIHGFRGTLWGTVNHCAFGFLLGAVREWRRSIVACIVAHSLLNATFLSLW